MVPNGSKWFQMVPNGSKWFQMVPNGSKWFQMIPNGYKWFQMFPIGFKWFQMIPKALIFRNGSKWFLMSIMTRICVLVFMILLANQNFDEHTKLKLATKKYQLGLCMHSAILNKYNFKHHILSYQIYCILYIIRLLSSTRAPPPAATLLQILLV